MRINVANRTSTGTKLSRVSVKSPGLMTANKGKPLCTYFERTGQCRYGDRCRYQHATSHNSAAAFSERSWSRSQVSLSPHVVCTHFCFTAMLYSKSGLGDSMPVGCSAGQSQSKARWEPEHSHHVI